MIRIARVAVLGMSLAVAPASAQLYKWVDERGVTHYGEKPPANKGAPVKLRDATGGPRPEEPASSSRTPRRQETELQRQDREFQERQARRDRELADEQRRQRDSAPSERSRASECRTARQDLATMQSSPTNYTYAEHAEARDRASRNCR
jgi:hypothetical protein